jgi:3-oxoacyl-[acyl-carrier protein] reductase
MTSYPELHGKTAVVTGSSTGIGEAIALALAREGVNVVVNGRSNREAALRVAGEVQELGARSIAVIADVSRPDEVARLQAEAESAFGGVDVLVNNAGGFPARRRLTEIPEDEWDQIVDVNLTSAFLCSRAALPGMLSRGWGRIVNISSTMGRTVIGLSAAHYAASKHGMLGFTRHLAREVAAQGVTVNATCPGTTVSDRILSLYDTPERQQRAISITPIGRLAEPDEQAGVVVFLCSNAASYITGATIDVSGGRVTL